MALLHAAGRPTTCGRLRFSIRLPGSALPVSDELTVLHLPRGLEDGIDVSSRSIRHGPMDARTQTRIQLKPTWPAWRTWRGSRALARRAQRLELERKSPFPRGRQERHRSRLVNSRCPSESSTLR